MNKRDIRDIVRDVFENSDTDLEVWPDEALDALADRVATEVFKLSLEDEFNEFTEEDDNELAEGGGTPGVRP